MPRATAGALAGICLLLSAAPAAADQDANIHKTFNVSSGGRLVISADRGAIDVTTGDADKVEVTVLRKVTRGSAGEAAKILADHQVTFQADGNQITVKAKFEGSIRPGWFGPNFQVHYEVTVPKNFNLDLQTAGGSINVPDLTGSVKANTAGGSIKTGRVDGTVNVRTAGGSLTIAAATGAAEAHTAGGSIIVGEAGASLIAETAGGSIRVGKALGKTKLATSGGSIEALDVHAGIEANTSGGSITASLAGTPAEDCRFETSGGSITLSLPAKTSANVDARTNGGSVSTDLPVAVQGAVKSSELVGKLGDGGHLIKLRTSAGNIRLRQL